MEGYGEKSVGRVKRDSNHEGEIKVVVKNKGVSSMRSQNIRIKILKRRRREIKETKGSLPRR